MIKKAFIWLMVLQSAGANAQHFVNDFASSPDPRMKSELMNYCLMFSTNGNLPLVTFGNENWSPAIVERMALWSWGQDLIVPRPIMGTCGRYFGIDGDWMYAGVPDPRAMILKGEADTANLGAAAFILELHSAPGGPGAHGLFNNPLYVATNGTTAIGNLTDAADQNDNKLQPPFWLTVYGDGSAWAGHTNANLPPFGIMPQALVKTPAAGAQEFDGANWYLTDTCGVRHVVAMMVENNTTNHWTNWSGSPVTVIADSFESEDEHVQIGFTDDGRVIWRRR